jgi:long-chain acyl-CoA synthetase
MLVDSLFAHAAGQPEALAILDEGGRHTYAQLTNMAGALAVRIRSQSARPRVGLLLPAGAGFVASFYGALLAAKTVVPLNFLLSDREIAHCIADSEIDAVLTVPHLSARLKETRLKVIDLSQLPSAPSDPKDRPQRESDASDDVAVLMYTSGTSGLPKGVLLSYSNLQCNVDAAIRHFDFQSRHKFLGVVPLFHVFGMMAMMLAPIQLGATVVYLSRFSPLGTVKAIKEHGISLMGGVPSMYAALLRLKEASAEDFKSIYGMISGAEPLPGSLRDAFAARFGVTLLDAYGMTETSLAIASNTPQVHKPGTVGKPVPGAEIRIADDEGNRVPPGESGEIWVRGPMVMQGYHNLPAETDAALTSDGYFRTGDIGKLDTDGFLHLTGRKKDLIIVSGEKVAPREIEEALMAHAAVAEAAVIGRKDPARGEAVIAFVTLREGQSPSAEELRQFCRERGLPPWKVPREIHLVPDLPRSPTGKVLKRELRPPDSGNASETSPAE